MPSTAPHGGLEKSPAMLAWPEPMTGLVFPTPEQGARLQRWLDELHRWNVRVNLTTVPAEQAWDRHVVESLRLLAHAAPQPGAAVVDVGSGGGVPGLPIAIVRPDLRVTLVDSDRRKAAFLSHVVGLLHLGDRVTVVDRRAESLGHDSAYREAYDLAVSRATAPAPVLCELALPLVRPGGRLAALLTDAVAAVAACTQAAQLLGGEMPRAVAAGVLVVPKAGPTSSTYPRREGVPARRPLA
jgi:16S rRNA (guanine527-N7)-methyltransferase